MSKKIRLLDAVSIGIGGMVGGGIFAVLGLAVSLAKGGTPLAFLLAGILAHLTAYSYSKLSKKYPDTGGTVRFVNEGFGRNVFSGSINNLLWVSYIIMLSLYASAFGSYAPNLIPITGDSSVDFHIYASAIILLATIINYYSVKIVSEIESWAVIIKLVILLAFVGVGIYGLFGNPNVTQLDLANWESPLTILAGGMVIFVAYEGFELIANAAPNIKNPEKNIHRAYLISITFVVALYIVIAIVTVGSLPFKQIAGAQDYVLAEAAKPMLGKAGFAVITVAAMISTFSAINASLYGGSMVNYEIAEDDELPHHFLSKLWGQPIGLIITSVFTLLLVNLLDLESISTAGSVGFILIFAVINMTGIRLYKEIDGVKWIPTVGFVLCTIALVVLIGYEVKSNYTGVLVSLGIIAFCFIAEWIFKQKSPILKKEQ